jgi:hypothetical protein
MFKKLFLLAMMLVLYQAVSARDIVFVFIGSPIGAEDTIEVTINSWVEVPVYFLCSTDSVNGADLVYPLGINNCYFDGFDSLASEFYYPFTEWDLAWWGNPNEDYRTDENDCTWDSYSAQGIANDIYPPYDSPYLHTEPGEPSIHGLTFAIHAVNDALLEGITACDAIGQGSDPCGGPPFIGDPEGSEGYTVAESFACYRFLDGGYLEGIALDQEQQPIAGVEVKGLEANLRDTTDAAGEFILGAFPPGNFNISFWHPDYEFAVYTNVGFTSGDTTSLEVTLEPLEGYYYLPGDANMLTGIWPPQVIGSDVTYLVNYFRSENEPCLLEDFFCAADVNGDCQIIGSDVTRLVSYFRGLSDLDYCPDYEPAWLTGIDCPLIPPPGWPGCE